MLRFLKITTILTLCLGLVAGVVWSQATAPWPSQRGEGKPYELLGTQVHDLPDQRRGIPYQVFVSLPPSYQAQPNARYPVVYVTDADYGFAMLRSIGRRMNNEGPRVREFILVGLSYGRGEDPVASRRRDYTPSPRGASDAPKGALHGQSLQYRDYLEHEVLPFIDREFRTDPGQRVLVGHSYGGLLGAQILLTKPELFAGYLLGSPSLWFDKRYLLNQAPALLDRQKDLAARVYMYVGEFEALRKGDPRYMQEVDMVRDNAIFHDMLRARQFPGLTLKSDVLPGEDHLSVAPRGFTLGLLELLPAARSSP